MISAAATVAGVVGFLLSESHLWAWLAIGAPASLAGALAWTAHDEHNARVKAESVTSPADQRRARLRELVDAAIQRGEYLAGKDAKASWHWWRREYQDWYAKTWTLVNGALGPTAADECFPPGASGTVATQRAADVNNGVRWLRALDLTAAPIMGDWQPPS